MPPSDPAPAARRYPRGLGNPYVQIAVGAVATTAAELLLKAGATETADAARVGGVFGVAALASWWTWGGIAAYILSFLNWIAALRYLPLGVAYCLINSVQVLVPAGAWLFRSEHVSPARWAGIALVTAGIVLIGVGRNKPAAEPEDVDAGAHA
ncbi:MAG TPA: SMR family transporter [Humisphaera sp.]